MSAIGHLADISILAANVCFWTMADIGGFLPETACPLMTKADILVSYT